MNETTLELPSYICHKRVHALKIKMIDVANLYMIPADSRYGKIRVSQEFMDKHKPFPEGYYVVYKDGYESYSPKGAFEAGYTIERNEEAKA